MAFEPIGGYPPIRPKESGQVNNKSLESRGFMGVAGIANVSDIMGAKKKKDFLSAFGTDEDIDSDMSRIYMESPNEYDEIVYEEPSQNSKKHY